MSDERTAEGLGHLQRAAMEMISAARAFLDVAEELVADPDKVADVVSVVSTMATSAAAKGRAATGQPPNPTPGVEHIDVS